METIKIGEELSILFVDDEPKIISGLVRNVGLMVEDWDVHLADSGAKALAIMERQKVDVVVSDLRMPGMDGADFLERVRERYPQTLRFVLSGYAKEDLMLKATGLAHRYLAKPCDTGQLVRAIEQVRRTQILLRNDEVVRFVNATGELHADNKPLQEVLAATNDPECAVERVAEIIGRNPTVHISVLHMANSAFFGSGGGIDSIDEALQRLGLEFVRGLAILELSKSRMSLPPDQMALMEAILRHSVECSSMVRQMRDLVSDPKLLMMAGSAALLHDLGKLVLLARKGGEYLELCQYSAATKRPIWELERKRFGCDHAAIGGCLLELWGLPEALIRAVAGHHIPRAFGGGALCPVSVLHLADGAAHELHPVGVYAPSRFDEKLMQGRRIAPKFFRDYN